MELALNIVNETKRKQGKELSAYYSLFNYKHALFICQVYRSRIPHSSAIDEALIQTYIAKTMLELNMIRGAIRHAEEALKIYVKDLGPENDLTKAADHLLYKLKFEGMVGEMVGKLTSDEDCLIMGKLSRIYFFSF